MAVKLFVEKTPESVGLIRIDPNIPPAGGIRVPVGDFDSWVTIAGRKEIDVLDLIEFNFQTKNPDVVNWYLREYVGCIQVSPDGNNWQFTTGTKGGKGVWKAGHVFIPPEGYIFGPDIVEGQGDAIMSSRLPNEAERRAGKDFFDKISDEAHKRATNYGALDSSTVEKIIADATDIYGQVDNVLNVTQEIIGFEIVGELASTVMLPVGSALTVIDALREIGESNDVLRSSGMRRHYYQALSFGMASGLDPNFSPRWLFRPNMIEAAIFRVGHNLMQNTSLRKKRELMFELIEHYYFQHPLGVNEKRPKSLADYKALMRGEVFDRAIMNRFEHNEYLFR